MTHIYLARRILAVIEDLRLRLFQTKPPAPLRNWPHCSDLYDMPQYYRSPEQYACTTACDQAFCHPHTCITKFMERSYFPASRSVCVPISHDDIHLPVSIIYYCIL